MRMIRYEAGNGWMDGPVYIWMDGWMEFTALHRPIGLGWMDGWLVGWVFACIATGIWVPGSCITLLSFEWVHKSNSKWPGLKMYIGLSKESYT